MADGTVSIELKLLMSSLKQQVAQASKIIKEGLSQAGGGLFGSGTGKGSAGSDLPAVDSATKKLVNLGTTLKSVRQAFRDAWSEANKKGSWEEGRLDTLRNFLLPGMDPLKFKMPIRVYGQGAQYSTATTPTAGIISGHSGPVPPIIPPQTVGSMFQNFVHGLSPMVKTAGLITAGLAALRVAIGLVTYAFRLILAPFQAAFRIFSQAAEQARQLYAKSLQSGGLPVGFVARRSALADILGVGERDVWQYSEAIKMLNEDIKYSTKVTTETNPALTAMGWEIKVIGQDVKAFFAAIAYDMAPAMNLALNVVHAALVDLTFAARMFAETAEFKLVKLLLKLAGMSPEAPAPAASAHRLQTSPWERMGLVLGSSIGADYAKQTANNTAKTVKELEKVNQRQQTRGREPGINTGFGLPSMA